MLLKLLDILRMVIVARAFFFGYQIGFQNGYDPMAQLHFMVPLAGWGFKAELTILLCFLFFIIFSGIKHAIDAVKRKNYKWQNINRPFIALLLVAGLIYPVVEALKGLGG